jgi:hypothetical protein
VPRLHVEKDNDGAGLTGNERRRQSSRFGHLAMNDGGGRWSSTRMAFKTERDAMLSTVGSGRGVGTFYRSQVAGRHEVGEGIWPGDGGTSLR